MRTRIATDLHDDIGSSLSQIAILSEVVRHRVAPGGETLEQPLSQIAESSRELVDSMSDIVWAINPRNDTITSLADYFGLYAQRLMGLASVGCGLDVAENLPNQPLAPRFRQELFLAFKEVLVNVVQHAHARKVWVHISIQDGEMVVIVTDNGCGIMPGKQAAGADGLTNMRKRMEALGGTCEIQSEQDKGTTVRLQAAIHKVS